MALRDLYCARGQAENLIKLHKTQLASDRTSCRSPRANQIRLVLHTAAYWLMLTVRDATPEALALAKAEFATIRLRLIKVAARVTEGAARIRIRLPSACPERRSSACSPDASPPSGHRGRGDVPRRTRSPQPQTHDKKIYAPAPSRAPPTSAASQSTTPRKLLSTCPVMNRSG